MLQYASHLKVSLIHLCIILGSQWLRSLECVRGLNCVFIISQDEHPGVVALVINGKPTDKRFKAISKSSNCAQEDTPWHTRSYAHKLYPLAILCLHVSVTHCECMPLQGGNMHKHTHALYFRVITVTKL